MSTTSTRKTVGKLRSLWRKAVTGNEEKRIREFVIENAEEPKNIRFLDKCAFTAGVLNILCCQYFLMMMPSYFWLWYTMVMGLLLTARVFHFRTLSYTYFLLDHCYFSIFCTFVQLYLLPQCSTLWKVCFLYSNGPLPLAILIWGNSFVFHDFDKMSSVYIHLLPSCLTYTMRWYGVGPCSSLLTQCTDLVSDGSFHHHLHNVNSNINSIINSNCNTSNSNININSNNNININISSGTCNSEQADIFSTLVTSDYMWGAGLYLLWQVCYFIQTEIIDKEKLDRRPEISTSLRWLSKDRKNFLGKLILRLCRRVGLYGKDEHYNSASLKTKVIFMVTQFVYSMLTFIVSRAVFYSQPLHLAHISFVFTVAVYNGGSYYVEIFSTRYQKLLETKERLRNVARQVAHTVAEAAILGEREGRDGGREGGGEGGGKEEEEEEVLRFRGRGGGATLANVLARNMQKEKEKEKETESGTDKVVAKVIEKELEGQGQGQGQGQGNARDNNDGDNKASSAGPGTGLGLGLGLGLDMEGNKAYDDDAVRQRNEYHLSDLKAATDDLIDDLFDVQESMNIDIE